MFLMNIINKSKVFGRITILAIFCILVICLLVGMNTISNKITVLDGENSYTKYTIATDIDQIIESEAIELAPNDVVEFSGFDENKQGVLNIMRAFPVSIAVDGTSHEVNIAEGTVADVLNRAGIALGEEDIVSHDLNAEVTANTAIAISRVTYEEVVSTEEIPYESVTTQTPLIQDGKTVVEVVGVVGEKTITTRNKLVDGVVQESVVVSEVVTTEPVTEKLKLGNKYVAASTIQRDIELDANGNPVNYLSVHRGKATAYSNFGRPTKLVQGSVAMDLSRFPKGTKLYVKTPDGSFIYGNAVVGDTGTALIEGHVLIDLFFVSYDDSVRFGAKTVDVYVLP